MKRAAIALVLLCCGCGVSQQQGLQMHKEIREQQQAIDDLRREYEDDVSQIAERLEHLESAASQPVEWQHNAGDER